MGARSAGMGNSTSCLADEWSTFNNVGGLSRVKETTVAFSYDAYPALVPANRTAAVVALPMKYGVCSAGVFRFGDALYNEQAVTAGFSNSFGITSLGARINYVQYNAEGFGSKGAISISAGSLTQLTPWLSIGVHVTNLNQPKISKDDDERLPTNIIAGIGLELSTKIFITTEVEKKLEYQTSWRVGCEYKAHKKVYFRSGINLYPQSASFGISFKPKKFILDYAYHFSFIVGNNHQATIAYKFLSYSSGRVSK